MIVMIVTIVPADFPQEIDQMSILPDVEQFDVGQRSEILEMRYGEVLAVHRMVCPSGVDPRRASCFHIGEWFPQYTRYR